MTERERVQNADFRMKPQIFADSPLLLEIQALDRVRKKGSFGKGVFSEESIF